MTLTWMAGKQTPQKTYITRVFNYGTWKEWRMLQKNTPRAVIEDAVKNPLPGQWTKHARRFAELVYHCSMPDSALIRYDISTPSDHIAE